MPITEYSPKSGLYLVAESIDCGGKGTIINAIKDDLVQRGKGVVDLRLLWPSDEDGKISGRQNMLNYLYKTDDVIPDFEKIRDHYRSNNEPLDAIICCEPTWAHVGLAIRKKIIHEVEGKSYTAKDTAQAYADDREELITRLIRPAIINGVDVYCERNFCSSIVYQSSMDDTLGIDHILELKGNRFAGQNSPHLYVICDISAETAMQRVAIRKKQDACKFEVLPFQKRIAQKYTSNWLKQILNSYGSFVVYVNTDKPTNLENTKSAALHIVELFKSGELDDGERFNFDII